MQQGPLILSSNKGRYAVCTLPVVHFDDEIYPDITAGMLVEVYLGGQWVQGRVEFGNVYAVPHDDTMNGYYFVGRDNSIVGLCAGTKVRILP